MNSTIFEEEKNRIVKKKKKEKKRKEKNNKPDFNQKPPTLVALYNIRNMESITKQYKETL